MIDPVVDVAELLNPQESRLERRVLRTLHRKGHHLSEGFLANYVRDKMNTTTWTECLSRLITSKMIEVVKVGYFGNTRRFALTEAGRERAKTLCNNR